MTSIRNRTKVSATAALCLVACLCASTQGRAIAVGEIGGDSVSADVDSPIARYFLEDYLRSRHLNPKFDSQIHSILAAQGKAPITNERLKAIADQTSPDFAAMVFAHLSTERNLGIKKAFLRDYALVKQGRVDLRSASGRYKVILVPGLFYRSKPETKGDLHEVKETLEAANFEVASVPIHDAGTVDQNAEIIAEFLKNEPSHGKEFIIVSTSKGGPETLYALGRLLDPESAKKVSVWFSVGGALRGSHLTDPWLRWPACWLASTIGLFHGFSIDMVASLGVEQSQKRMEQVRIPGNIRVVHFVGVPLSGTLIDEVKGGYKSLKPFGPNDGVTLLPDEILEGSTVITALGLDHWYRDPDLRRKILALVTTVTNSKPGSGRSNTP